MRIIRWGIRLVSVVAAGAALAAFQTPPQNPRDAGAAQAPPAVKGVIAGTVVASDSGRPVRKASVTVSGGDVRTVKTAIADDQGRFSFIDLPAGEFTLSASRQGFLDVVYGQKRPGSGRPGTPLTLLPGQKMERVAIALPRGGVITGTVYDETGDVSYGTSVQALRYVMRTGVKTLQVVRTVNTDDRGIYRIPVLAAGEYVVMAVPRDINLGAIEAAKMRAEAVMVEASRAGAAAAEKAVADVRAMMESVTAGEDAATGYTNVYHPSVLQASEATAVTVQIGEERTGVDLRLQIVPLSKITGIVTADGAIPPGTIVNLIDTREGVAGAGVRSARVTPDGRFTFTSVPPGPYVLTARSTSFRARADAPRVVVGGPEAVSMLKAEAVPDEVFWAQTEIAVAGGPVSGVALSLHRGMTVSGSVQFDGPATPDFTKLRLTMAPAGESSQRVEGQAVRDVTVDADGRFTIIGVLPGRYRVVPSSGVPPGFLIESAMFGGRDVLDLPLDVKPGEDVSGGVVMFSNKQAELSGALIDAAGKPAPDYTLILFAADNRFWLPQSRRIQAARPASNGRYSFRSLPAGDYRLVAVEDIEPGQWFDPAFLKELVASAMPLTLGKGEKRTQDVKVSGGDPSTPSPARTPAPHGTSSLRRTAGR
jgi:hypothetical protein